MIFYNELTYKTLMTNENLNAMINSEILYYFSSFDTCKNDIKENNGTFFIEFANNVDSSHTVNKRHHNNSILMQKRAEEFYFSHNLTPEEKTQFAKFQEWLSNANEEQKEEYDEFEIDYINYSDCGHDNLFIFSVVWKIEHTKDGVYLHIGDDVTQYIFFPKLDDERIKIIKLEINDLLNFQEKLKTIF